AFDPTTAQWIGRRFSSVAAFHAALDRLVEAGYDEETVLAHLPANPVAFPQELDEALLGLDGRGQNIQHPAAGRPFNKGETEELKTSVPNAAGVRKPTLGDLLEYFTQIQTLLDSASSRETACDRFLHALAPLAPFGQMEIYLPSERRGRDGENLV